MDRYDKNRNFCVSDSEQSAGIDSDSVSEAGRRVDLPLRSSSGPRRNLCMPCWIIGTFEAFARRQGLLNLKPLPFRNSQLLRLSRHILVSCSVEWTSSGLILIMNLKELEIDYGCCLYLRSHFAYAWESGPKSLWLCVVFAVSISWKGMIITGHIGTIFCRKIFRKSNCLNPNY